MNILIAEDDATSRFLLKSALTKLGHDVTEAQDGIEALSHVESAQISLVVSDLMMPRMDGLELCRRIRAARLPHYIYFILLTFVEGKSAYISGMEAGADDFLNKPIDLDMLAARVAVAQRILSLQVEVSQLTGLLPICSICKKVRDDQNYWHQVESYIERHSDAEFTHSYCPDCFKKLLSEAENSNPT